LLKLRRTFILFAVLLFSTSFHSLSMASNIFHIEVSLTNLDTSKKNLTKKEIFNQSLEKAANLILIKLSANLSINEKEEAQKFLKRPRSWLRSYYYQPVMSEGVNIGQKIVFVFNKKLLYKYFQDNNLIIWPANRRPLTLIHGTQRIDRSITRIKEDNIDYMPTLDYRPIAKQFGLPIKVASTETLNYQWILPSYKVSKKKIVSLVKPIPARYLLSFQEKISSSEKRVFSWKLYNRYGRLALSSNKVSESSRKSLKAAFTRLTRYYSQRYRDDAVFLSSVNLTVSKLDDFKKIAKTEQALNELKPSVHEVRMIDIKGNRVSFEIIYRGTYRSFLNKIRKLKNLKLMPSSSSTGKVRASWR